MSNVSPNVVILTRQELADREARAYQRGVERGKLEAALAKPDAGVSQNCANWKDGRCDTCGVPWQDFEVSRDFACPYFTLRSKAAN